MYEFIEEVSQLEDLLDRGAERIKFIIERYLKRQDIAEKINRSLSDIISAAIEEKDEQLIKYVEETSKMIEETKALMSAEGREHLELGWIDFLMILAVDASGREARDVMRKLFSLMASEVEKR